MISVEQINEFNEKGVRSGDCCEKCETAAKPVYHLKSSIFELDIILCPNCVKVFQKLVGEITLERAL